TWTRTNMTALRGWAPRGLRLQTKAPHGHWKTTTFLAALRHDRLDAPWLFDGPIDGESFRTYVEKVLVPTLRPGDIVIMDNLGSHKAKAVRQQGRRPLRRNHLHRDGRNPRIIYTRRMRQLFSKFRLCANLKASCSSHQQRGARRAAFLSLP